MKILVENIALDTGKSFHLKPLSDASGYSDYLEFDVTTGGFLTFGRKRIFRMKFKVSTPDYRKFKIEDLKVSNIKLTIFDDSIKEVLDKYYKNFVFTLKEKGLVEKNAYS